MQPAPWGQVPPAQPPWEFTEIPDGRIFADFPFDLRQGVWDPHPPEHPRAIWYALRPKDNGPASYFKFPEPLGLWIGIQGRMVSALEAGGFPVVSSAEETVHAGKHRPYQVIVTKLECSSELYLRIAQWQVVMIFEPSADPIAHRRAKGVLLTLFDSIWKGLPSTV